MLTSTHVEMTYCSFLATGSERASIKRNTDALGISRSSFARFMIDLAMAENVDPDAIAQRARQRIDKREWPQNSRFSDAGDNSVSISARIPTRITTNQKEWVRSQAKDAGLTFSAWLRALLTVPVEIVDGKQEAIVFVRLNEATTDLDLLRREVLRIGQNCNQIAWALNVSKKKNWINEKDAIAIFGNAQATLQRIEGSIEEIVAAISHEIDRL
ncbi:MAG: hypothetical protein RR619_08160, partial [Raoultibacter sp.]